MNLMKVKSIQAALMMKRTPKRIVCTQRDITFLTSVTRPCSVAPLTPYQSLRALFPSEQLYLLQADTHMQSFCIWFPYQNEIFSIEFPGGGSQFSNSLCFRLSTTLVGREERSFLRGQDGRIEWRCTDLSTSPPPPPPPSSFSSPQPRPPPHHRPLLCGPCRLFINISDIYSRVSVIETGKKH